MACSQTYHNSYHRGSIDDCLQEVVMLKPPPRCPSRRNPTIIRTSIIRIIRQPYQQHESYHVEGLYQALEFAALTRQLYRPFPKRFVCLFVESNEGGEEEQQGYVLEDERGEEDVCAVLICSAPGIGMNASVKC